MKEISRRPFKRLLGYVLTAFFIAAAANADDAMENPPCEPIQLPAHASEKVIDRMLLPETQHCYVLSLPAGQAAELRLAPNDEVENGNAIVFDIADHARSQTSYRLAGQPESYVVVIFQRRRSITPQYYRLTVDTMP